MRLGSEEQLVPSRTISASREVVRSRQYVDAARRSLAIAVEIYTGAGEDPASVPLAALERVLGQLEEAEAALWEVAQ
jgi:hypothetical protein